MNRKLHNDQDYPIANREYKDGLFRMVFQKKEDLLSLYNALNGSSYTDPDELEVNTLGNVLYLTRKNDISFLISGMMNLYEHQSTFNPNMPVRGLIYLCRLYEKYIVKNEIDIYTSSLKELPFPQYFVFYNGTEKEPDRQELKLSDMFKAPPVSRTPALECIATMLSVSVQGATRSKPRNFGDFLRYPQSAYVQYASIVCLENHRNSCGWSL